jgi:hypothetical protein
MYKFLIVVLLLSSLQIVAQRPKRNLKLQMSPMDTLNIRYHSNKKNIDRSPMGHRYAIWEI